MDCSITFDIGATSELYAQLTGLLAGFSFTAVVIALSRSLERTPAGQTPAPDPIKESLDRALPVMICSFLALVITSLTYSAITGDADNTGRATIEELVGGLTFQVSGIIMFYSVVLLLEAAEAWEAANHSRRLLGQFVTLVSFAYITNGLDDYNDARFRNGTEPPTWVATVTYSLLAVYAVYAVAGYFLYHRLPHIGGRSVTRNAAGQITSTSGAAQPDHKRMVQKIATISLLTVIACAVGVGYYSAYGGEVCSTAPLGVAVGIMVLSFAVSVAFSTWFFLSRQPDLE
ncbi:hypothetical protein [Streptomyces tauricus]|uniref:hypothetical protein n=1 Tax=Streptomyces tauricus TaxID=68274 RepID=UPI0033B77EB2